MDKGKGENEINLEVSIEKCINSLGEKFLKWPFNFFTESDAHSYLYYYIFRFGSKALKILYTTKDKGIKTVLVHREYPTIFRFTKENMELSETGGRGHYDLVILNPKFITKHSIDEVIAKKFKKCKLDEKHHLISAIEFKFIVNPLSANIRNEIKKDFKKLSMALDSEQTRSAYLIVFNRCRPETKFIEELKELSKTDYRVRILYIESIKLPDRKYKIECLNNWNIRMRFSENKINS